MDAVEGVGGVPVPHMCVWLLVCICTYAEDAIQRGGRCSGGISVASRALGLTFGHGNCPPSVHPRLLDVCIYIRLSIHLCTYVHTVCTSRAIRHSRAPQPRLVTQKTRSPISISRAPSFRSAYPFEQTCEPNPCTPARNPAHYHAASPFPYPCSLDPPTTNCFRTMT
jgi:hypothetical protein